MKKFKFLSLLLNELHKIKEDATSMVLNDKNMSTKCK